MTTTKKVKFECQRDGYAGNTWCWIEMLVDGVRVRDTKNISVRGSQMSQQEQREHTKTLADWAVAHGHHGDAQIEGFQSIYTVAMRAERLKNATGEY